MNLYDRYLLPMLVHRTCSATSTMRQRAKVVPLARGDVPEPGPHLATHERGLPPGPGHPCPARARRLRGHSGNDRGLTPPSLAYL